jgi:(4-O-methyl)-D-glucuronate---lignin esterase
MIRPIFWFLARLPLLVLILVVALVMSSCTMLGMNYASLETDNKPAPKPALNVPAITTEGSPEREALKQRFEDVLYGPWPAGMPVSFGDWQMIDPEYLDGRGTLEEVEITIGSGDGARSFMMVTAFPKASRPVPVVISQTFADTCSVFPDEPVTNSEGQVCDGGMMEGFPGWAATQIFGTYIALAPVERYFDAGLAYASFYASDFIPDRKKEAPEAMTALGGPVNPTSALMAWAYSFSAATDVLEADPRIDPQEIAVMGHSRHGKSALIAAVWDRRIAAVVAHQSGFAGASLSRSHTGERLDRMAKAYPHWLAPQAQDWLGKLDAIPVDQHELLALVAPTPVLLGNGRRDVWSDPNSSFRAAEAASAAYEVTGHPGLTVSDMQDFDPAAGIAWWLRPGGHSVVSEDIDAFTTFLHDHLVRERPPQYAVH